MKSIGLKILVWCFAIVLAALLTIAGLVILLPFTNFGPLRMIRDSVHLQADEAVLAYRNGGVPQLSAYFERVERHFSARHYLAGPDGRDIVTGEDMTPILRAAKDAGLRPVRYQDDLVVVVPSPDSEFHFIMRRPPPTDVATQLPYIALILAAMALFCWILAVDIARPLKEMAERVSRFGAGHLDERIRIERPDEIGRLGAAFDEMANRIQTLLQAERRLLQDVSHELRSPLTRLGVAAQLVKQEAHRDVAIARIEREVERLGVLIGDLAAVTKAEGEWTSAGPLHTVRLDILAAEIVEGCEVEARAGGRSIAWNNLAGEVELRGSAELLWRAIENVLRNAILHTPEGSAIACRLERTADSHLQLTVRDRGPGVAPEDLVKIFRPFYRSDPSRTANTGGVGLGLAIAQRAVALHHGEISAVNANPGLKVIIRLPGLNSTFLELQNGAVRA